MDDSISGIDFLDGSYVLKQKAVRTVRNSYRLCDSDENEVLGARQNQKLLELGRIFGSGTRRETKSFGLRGKTFWT